MNEPMHLHGNNDEWTRCGFTIFPGGANCLTTNDIEKCTCRDCLKYMLRDAMNRFLFLDEG